MMSSAACAKLYRRASELTCVRLRAGTLRARAPAGREMRASIMVFRGSGKAGSCSGRVSLAVRSEEVPAT
jgi:hypothetical protein